MFKTLRFFIPFLLITPAFPVDVPPRKPAKVYHILPHELDEMEDQAYAAFLQKTLETAKKNRPDLIVLEINTPGGELTATLKIKNLLLSTDINTVCWINKNAISAGSLIALSCRKIAIAPGGIIGAATPVFMTQEGMKKAMEKVVSAGRAAWRGAAEANGKNPDVAEAFVDEKVVLTGKKHGIEKKAGKLLTLTGKEALKIGIADFSAANMEDIGSHYGITMTNVETFQPSFQDKLLAFFLHPIVSGLLIGLGFLGLMYELKIPGWGIPGSFGLLFLSTYFISRILIGQSGWGAPALFALALILLLLEIFVIPGFGIAGIVGIFSLVGSILWSYGAESFQEGLWVTALALCGTFLGTLFLLKVLPKFAARGSNFFLAESVGEDHSYDHLRNLIGKTGIAKSFLRPAGIIEVEEGRLDVISAGDFIEIGEKVTIVDVQGSKILVKKS